MLANSYTDSKRAKFQNIILSYLTVILFCQTVLFVDSDDDNKATIYCSEDDSELIAKYFKQLITDRSHCPSESWLEAFYELSPSPKKIFINVGFNKGYNFAIWASLWAPHANVNKKTWHESLISLGIDDCGVCDDCKTSQTFNSSSIISNIASFKSSFSTTASIQFNSSSTLTMIGYDLNSKNIYLIKNVTKILNNKFKNLQPFISIKVFHAAVTNHNNKVSNINDCFAGREDCSMEDMKGRPGIDVRGVSIDRVVERLSLQKSSSIHSNATVNHDILIDILLIDAEGHDPLVLAGSIKSLKMKRIRVIIFEYHSVALWRISSLETWVTKLAVYGYVCYFEGTDRLWRITGNSTVLFLMCIFMKPSCSLYSIYMLAII